MKKRLGRLLCAAIFACAAAAPATAQVLQAQQLTPVYIDPDHGFVYFLVKNNGSTTIHNLFGWVFGFGSPAREGAYLVNNPHSEGLKVSLGPHIPGSVALYRFMAAPDNMDFANYRLLVHKESLRFPEHGYYHMLRRAHLP